MKFTTTTIATIIAATAVVSAQTFGADDIMAQVMQNPEVQEQMQALMQNPEVQEHMKAAMQDPAVQEQIKAAMQDPEVQEQIKAAMKNLSPEEREQAKEVMDNLDLPDLGDQLKDLVDNMDSAVKKAVEDEKKKADKDNGASFVSVSFIGTTLTLALSAIAMF